MRKLQALLILCMLLSLPALLLAQANISYSIDGVSFSYPPGWELEEDDFGVVLYGDATVVIIEVLPWEDTPLDALLLEFFRPYDDTLEFQPWEVELEIVAGNPAAVLYYEDDDGEDLLDAMLMVIGLDQSLIVVVDAYAPQDLFEWNQVLDIAGSIQLSGSVPTAAGPVIVASGDTPRFEPDTCPFPLPANERANVSCGWLIVPESRSTANSPTIRLAVAIIASTNPGRPADSIVYLEGGPGGSALAAVDFWLTSALRNSRDLILIDQRGAGYSQPSLSCVPDEEADDPTAACAARLRREGINLAAYNSVENAADIADLIVALGLPQANLYGVSYGTRLALTVLRDHPQNIRSAIIDAVYPPHVTAYDEQPLWAVRAFNVLFDECAADRACNAAFPNLRQVFYDVVDDLNDEPLLIEDEFGEAEFGGYELVDQFFQLLYDTSVLPELPSIIYALAEGDYDVLFGEDEEGGEEEMSEEEFEQLMMDYLGLSSVEAVYDYLSGLTEEEQDALFDELEGGGVDTDGTGMFNSMECYDELPFNSFARAESLSAGLPPQIVEAMLIGIDRQFGDCAIWDVPAAPASTREPVVSTVPVLVLSGNYDPITPPEWGQAAADYLPNSYHFVFPGIGHGAVDSHPCPTQIALHFLNVPEQEPDSFCIGEMRIEFYIP